jgi:excisionase family DNA binding protein
MKEEDRLQRIEFVVEEIKQLLQQLIGNRPVNGMEETDGYLNVKQAAKLLGVEPSTIYAKCHNHNLPHTRIGKYYKFKRSELLAWVHPSNDMPSVNVDDYVDKYLQNNSFRG